MSKTPHHRGRSLLACVGALAGVAFAIPQSHAAGAVPTAELKYQQADPALYETARKYFPGDESDVPSKRIFRLTRDQIDTTAKALLPGFAAKSVKSAMPRDALQTNYEYAELLSFTPANIGALSGWIAEIGGRVKQNPGGVIDCPAPEPAQECLKAQARRFILKAFRGDVSDAKVDKIVAFYLAGVQSGGFPQATSELVELVLNSPDFLFRKELDVNKNNRLSPAQLLQAVTYTIADVPPDTLNLSSEKADQYLRSGAEAGATIAAILSSKEAREKVVRFFSAWLEIREPGDFTISTQVFPEFNGKLAAAMIDETRQFLRAQLAKPSPRLTDITLATQSYVSKALEPIYGVKFETTTGPTKVTALDPAQRLGIFSQPAVLASHSGPTDTRPIKRGVFWVRKVMCMDMEPPPKHLDAKLYEAKGATERQRIEQSTSQSACAGCHKLINPLGFFQERYDALGRWRTVDNGHPVDTSILIDFLDEAPKQTETPVEALKVLTNSAMFKQCFVRQMFRFYMGRTEEPADDPLLRRMFFEFAYRDGQDIIKTVMALTSSDRIVRRK